MGRRDFANRGKTDFRLETADADIMSQFGNLRGERRVRLDEIISSKDVQVRVGGLDEENVQRLMAVVENGGELPPIIAYETDRGLFVADGFHRVEVARRLGSVDIRAEVRKGSYEDALDFAEEANLKHGKMLSAADKKNLLIRRLSRGHEWAQTSNREIARQLGVDHKTISNWIGHYNSTGEFSPVERTVTRGGDGKVRDVTGIQTANQAREDVPPAAPVEPMPETPAGQRRQVAYLVERLEKLDQRIHNAKVAGDEKRVKELEEHKQNIEAHLKRVEAVKFLTPNPSPLVGEGRPDGPPYVSIDEVMAGEHLRESDLGKALRVIREMDGLLDTLVELLNASGGDWEESGQADVTRQFRGFVDNCGKLLGDMRRVWGS